MARVGEGDGQQTEKLGYLGLGLTDIPMTRPAALPPISSGCGPTCWRWHAG